jgi:hypothetical protein
MPSAYNPKKCSVVGHIYVFQCGPYYKVGLSENWQKRLDAIKYTSPFRVRKVMTRAVPWHGLLAAEQHAHRALAYCRLRGEWFAASKAELAEVVRTSVLVGKRVAKRIEAYGPLQDLITERNRILRMVRLRAKRPIGTKVTRPRKITLYPKDLTLGQLLQNMGRS